MTTTDEKFREYLIAMIAMMDQLVLSDCLYDETVRLLPEISNKFVWQKTLVIPKPLPRGLA